jgi:hypothetical protein
LDLCREHGLGRCEREHHLNRDEYVQFGNGGYFDPRIRGRRPFNGENGLFQNDPHWRDHILFNEYFNGDNGTGVGASHQTGWTALIAKMIRQLQTFDRNG